MRALLVLLLLVALARVAFGATSYHPPLDAQVDLSELPADAVRPVADGGQPIPERIRVKQLLYQELKNDDGKDIGAKLTLDLLLAEAFELEIPGLESVLTVAFATGEAHGELVLREERASNPDEDYPFILTLIPGEHLVAIRFRSDVLRPVQTVTYRPYSGTPPKPELRFSAGVRIQVRYTWDGESEVGLVGPDGLRPKLSLNTPVEIGETGVVLEVEDAELDLSRLVSPPGRPAAWTGVFFKKLAVNFVNGLEVPRVEHGPGAAALPPEMAGVALTDFSIGSGGVTGGICGNLSAGPVVSLFGSSFQLERLCVALEEGALTAGEAAGVLTKFPFFDAPVRLTLALSLEGNFKVGLAPPNPASPTTATTLTVPNVLTYRLQALSVERKGSIYLWKTSGKLNVHPISEDPDDAIQINGLTITSEGQVSVEGGWIVLPEKQSIDFNGFELELREIGFGVDQPDTPNAKTWVGFTGGVKLSSGFDAASRFKRLRFLWPGASSSVDVRLEGVEVAFKKPGVMSFAGSVDFFEDEATGTKGFAGTVSCDIEAIKVSMAGRLTIGTAAPPGAGSFPFFYLDLAAQLPTGIPIYGNVSLYGFLGLFAYNVGPNLHAFTTPVQWFEAHRTATNILAGAPPPWTVDEGAFALGAGAIIGTTADDGYAVNAKLAVQVSMPGPIIMLQGAANIAKKRGELTGTATPAFVCLAVFDGSAQTFLLNIGAYYTVQNLIEVKGEAEAFFNLADPNDWHLWIGKKEPESRRVQAEVLSFLKANAYFMIDPSSAAQGAKAGYSKKWKFGPLRVDLEALFAYDMELSYRPAHIWGSVELHGNVELEAFGVGVGLSANALLEGATPRPLFVDGTFRVKLNLPWPLPDPKADVHLRWEQPKAKEPLDELVSGLSIESRKSGVLIEPDTVSLSAATTPASPPPSISASSLCSPGDSLAKPGEAAAHCSRPLVPLDVLLVAGFQRPTNDPANLGWGNSFDWANPLADRVGDTTFRYDVTGVELMAAEKASSTLHFVTALEDLYGAWPALAGGSNPAPLFLKLFSRNPLDVYQHSTYLFYEDGTKGWTEWAADTYGASYCQEPRQVATTHSKDGCRLPPWLVAREDFILPPYSAFRLTVDGEVERSTTGPERTYRNSAIFHTEGPPLDLAPYVDTTTPMSDLRPHYRGFAFGIRFNETYLDLMYHGEGQLFQLQVVDDNDQPPRVAGSEAIVVTSWDLASDHVPRPTEDDWLEFLRQSGVPIDAVVPRDDVVFGQVSSPPVLLPGVRYRVKAWLEDARLASDARLADAAWLEAYPVHYHSGDRAVLYEFSFVASRYVSFSELIGSRRRDYVDRPVTSGANRAEIATLARAAAGAVASFPPSLDNSDTDELARFLRHALAPRGPAEVSEHERNDWIRRAPGYHGKPERMSDANRQQLLGSWLGALEAYERIEKALGLETFRGPLPDSFEVRPLVQNGEVIGLLCESPEALDFTRINVHVQRIPGSASEALVVPNRDGTRFFVFRAQAGTVAPWIDGLWALRFSFHHVVSSRYPELRAPFSAGLETPVVLIDLPGDRFNP